MTTRRTEESGLADRVVWHDVECGSYGADLALWRELADGRGGPILDVGAGTGRVTLDLARRGHSVTALDIDGELLSELTHRAAGLDVEAVQADARAFDLQRAFALIVVPMQTIQLLHGREERRAFLTRARRHLERGGVLAIAITEQLELYEEGWGLGTPLPDMLERDGTLYSSFPTAIRERGREYLLERRRERVAPDGNRATTLDAVAIERLTAQQLEDEARGAGLKPAPRRVIHPTTDHVGSLVVMLHG